MLVDDDLIGEPEISPIIGGASNNVFSQGMKWHEYPKATTFVIIIRFAEVLLIYAEASNEEGSPQVKQPLMLRFEILLSLVFELVIGRSKIDLPVSLWGTGISNNIKSVVRYVVLFFVFFKIFYISK